MSATRRGSRRLRARYGRLRIIWWSAGPLPAPPIPRPQLMPSRRKSRRLWHSAFEESASKTDDQNKGSGEMAKGYWIARVDVHNDEGYKPYALANPGIFKKFGGRFIVRGGQFTGAEGDSRSRNVVIEFPDYETAMAC